MPFDRRYSEEEIKTVANAFRKKLGIERIERPDMRAVLAKIPELFPGVKCLQVSDKELPDAEGMYDPINRVLKFPDRVFDRLDRNDCRARFSIAHELAHVALGHREIRFRHTQLNTYERAKSNIHREEMEANAFAGFFLAPDHLCEGCNSVEDYMDKFGFSRRAAEIRKQDRDRDLRRQRGEERDLPAKVVDLLQYLRSKGHRVTSLRDEPQGVQSSRPQQSSINAANLAADSNSVEPELCPNCGNLSLSRNGLQLKCQICERRLDL